MVYRRKDLGGDDILRPSSTSASQASQVRLLRLYYNSGPQQTMDLLNTWTVTMDERAIRTCRGNAVMMTSGVRYREGEKKYSPAELSF